MVLLMSSENYISIKKSIYLEKKEHLQTVTSGLFFFFFFLISVDLLTDGSDCKIIPGYRTDHSIVLLDVDFGKFKKGRSYRKFNNSLLHDKDYINQIKQLIIEIKRRNATDIQLYQGTIEEIPNDQLQLSINDQLFLEVLLMKIRGNSIS